MIRSQSGRGRHKLFIGMAPGVGKTYRMLQEGREMRRAGTDVVIGVLETHGRVDTAAQAEGLERVPLRRLHHQGVWLEELDVAALLARRPQLVLVDELAHTNAPGSDRVKRWQDVEHLLAAGVDVYSTVNIQHLESLNDLVAQLTGVTVRERLPDRVLERADEVVLVDVTPETLQERLRDGKVYASEKVGQALAHFFQRRNLVALRELALREVADRVDDETSPDSSLRERVLVCLSMYPGSRRLLRRAARLAGFMDAPLLVVIVLNPHSFLTRDQSALLEECKRLCEDFGGEFLRIDSDDVLDSIARVAIERRITQIVMGQAPRSRGRSLLGRSLAEKLQQRLVGRHVDLHLIADDLPTPGQAGA
ncbi:histidine kinase [Synechococcus sp. MW101C3]|uniref:histidine kinase n=1 Tax=Synechococcus sp. MW101C3 TaxID=210768 RepID=UPI000B996D0E|nr:histidine kinase [Synechococcus sp. MW101C3]